MASYKLAGKQDISVEYIDTAELMSRHTFKMTTPTKGTSIDLIIYFDAKTGKFVNPKALPKGSAIRKEFWKLIEQPDGSLIIHNQKGELIDLDDIPKYLPNDM